MTAKFKLNLTIFIIWLFNVSGVIGILSDYSDWFLSLTPLNLLVYFLAILINLPELKPRFFLAFSIPFFIGFITEFLGVNYGLLFGSYEYGENLGFKIYGVPFMICINWGVLTVITADIVAKVSNNIWLKSIFGGILMVLIDVIIEISAPRFDFWEFENSIIPLKNYIAWFYIGTIAHFGYQKLSIKTNSTISFHIFIAMVLFFITFIFF